MAKRKKPKNKVLQLRGFWKKDKDKKILENFQELKQIYPEIKLVDENLFYKIYGIQISLRSANYLVYECKSCEKFVTGEPELKSNSNYYCFSCEKWIGKRDE